MTFTYFSLVFLYLTGNTPILFINFSFLFSRSHQIDIPLNPPSSSSSTHHQPTNTIYTSLDNITTSTTSYATNFNSTPSLKLHYSITICILVLLKEYNGPSDSNFELFSTNMIILSRLSYL